MNEGDPGGLPEQAVGVLLAAGNSSRFGSDKRWHRLADGTPMLLRSASALRDSCSRVVVVLRRDDDELATRCSEIGCEVVRNPYSASGMGASLACGVSAAADASGWLIALADMPFIQPATYQAVLGALARGASLARPRFQDRPGHPVGFSLRWREALTTLRGDRGARDIIDASGDTCSMIDVDDPGIVHDLDRPVDGVMPPVGQPLVAGSTGARSISASSSSIGNGLLK